MDRSAEVYWGNTGGQESKRILRERLDWAVEQVEGGPVLDIGCSQGVVSILLGRRGYRVDGIDISAEVIEYGQRLLSKEDEEVQTNVRFQHSDFASFQGQGGYQTVLLGEVIEHLVDPAAALGFAHEQLVEGGTLILTTPFGVHPHDDHHHTFMIADFVDLLKDEFSIVQLDAVDGYIRCVARKGGDCRRPKVDEQIAISEKESKRKQDRLFDQIAELRGRRDSLYAQLTAEKQKSYKTRAKLRRLETDWDKLCARVGEDFELENMVRGKAFYLMLLLYRVYYRLRLAVDRQVFALKRKIIENMKIGMQACEEDSKDQSRLLRSAVKFAIKVNPGFAAVYFRSQGDMRTPLNCMQKFGGKWAKKYLWPERLADQVGVLDNGWPEPVKQPIPDDISRDKAVLTLHNSFPHDGAGYAVRSHNMAKHILEKGFDLKVCTRLGYPWDLTKHAHLPKNATDTVESVTYSRLADNENRLGTPETKYIEAYGKALVEAADETGARIFHGASNYVNGMAATHAAAISGGKAIYEFRGLWHLTRLVSDPQMEGKDEINYCELGELTAAKRADGVIAISHALKNWLVGKGVEADKISVVPNAVDTNRFKPMEPDTSLKQELGLEGKTVIGFIGSLTKYEGLEFLIDAVDGLAKKGSPVALLIVGDGPYAGGLKDKLGTMGNPGHVKMTGRVPFSEVERYYSIVDILPFPRRDFDVCRYVPPLKILEAMAMEKCVMISSLAPLLEMVTDGETGVVVKPDDVVSLSSGLEELLTNPDRIRLLGRQAGVWVREERSWESVSNKVLHVYRNI